MQSQKRRDTILSFTFGGVVLLIVLVIAFLVPEPKRFAEFVFQTALALAGAGLAAVIPGTIQVTNKVVRATGAIAVFAVIFFFGYPKCPDCPDRVGSIEAISLGTSQTMPLSVLLKNIERNYNVTIELDHCSPAAAAPAVEPGMFSGDTMQHFLENVLYRTTKPNGLHYSVKVVQKGVRYEIVCSS